MGIYGEREEEGGMKYMVCSTKYKVHGFIGRPFMAVRLALSA